MKKLTDEVIKKMVSCLDRGMPIRDVATIVGCSPSIVQRYKNKHNNGELALIENESKSLCKKLEGEMEKRRAKYVEKMSDMMSEDLEKIANIKPEDLEGLGEKYEVIGKLHKVGRDVYNLGTEGGGINVNFMSAVKVEKGGEIKEIN